MKYLLDTCTALWSLIEPDKLSPVAKSILKDVKIPICISVVSAWEVAIKTSRGKLNFDGGSQRFLHELAADGIIVLDLKGRHVKHIETLPFIHRDPFDRMIIATALSYGMTILTADENIVEYDVPCLW